MENSIEQDHSLISSDSRSLDRQLDFFEVKDSSWGDRKKRDKAIAVKHTFSTPYPLRQPSLDENGHHQTNVTLKTNFAKITFICTKEHGIPVARDKLVEILVWTLALQGNTRFVEFGSVEEILGHLGISKSKKSYDWLKSSFLRLATSSVIIMPLKGEEDQVELIRPENWIEYMNLWFKEDYNKKEGNLIVIKESFFNKMKESFNLNLDLKVLRQIKNCAGASTLYLKSILFSSEVNDSPSQQASMDISDFKSQMGISESIEIPKFKNDLKRWQLKVENALDEVYEGKGHKLPLRMLGNKIHFGKACLLPNDNEELNNPEISNYLNSIKSHNAQEREQNYLKSILASGYSSEECETALLEVKKHGDFKYRQVKKIWYFLAKCSSNKETEVLNIELILNRYRNRENAKVLQ
ncbi:MAG: hypothetical protein ACPGJV_13075 [Bacteriovoracaceae bacterium]